MIVKEYGTRPDHDAFDIAILALGYESRCRYVCEQTSFKASHKLCLEFGFLKEGSFSINREFFAERDFEHLVAIGEGALERLAERLRTLRTELDSERPARILIDVSSMSREMIANVIIAVNSAFCDSNIELTAAYAPSKFQEATASAPILQARPVTRALSGWSSRPDLPLGLAIGLSCEEGLALGALQFLEPAKAWLFEPSGLDERFDKAVGEANADIEDIFDVTRFHYEINSPVVLRAKFEALLNSVDPDFRVIAIPFGPKIFAFGVISTVTFLQKTSVGVWAFSSYEQGHVSDRQADGTIIWHRMDIAPRDSCPI